MTKSPAAGRRGSPTPVLPTGVVTRADLMSNFVEASVEHHDAARGLKAGERMPWAGPSCHDEVADCRPPRVSDAGAAGRRGSQTPVLPTGVVTPADLVSNFVEASVERHDAARGLRAGERLPRAGPSCHDEVAGCRPPRVADAGAADSSCHARRLGVQLCRGVRGASRRGAWGKRMPRASCRDEVTGCRPPRVADAGAADSSCHARQVDRQLRPRVCGASRRGAWGKRMPRAGPSCRDEVTGCRPLRVPTRLLATRVVTPADLTVCFVRAAVERDGG